jgi:hypothetical protein
LSANVLSDLRIFTRARVVYALTAAKVAGAISQTAFYDYRLPTDSKTHFGPPLTSVELFLKDTGAHKTTDDKIEGQVRKTLQCCIQELYTDTEFVDCGQRTLRRWRRGQCRNTRKNST